MMQTQVQKHQKEQVQTPKEVTEAIRDTFVALHAIEQNKLDEAKKALKAADEKFSAVLKKHPEFDLLPLEETLTAYTYPGSSKDIEAALKVSIELIKAHDTQVARALMMTLKDELDINIVSIPMKLYPASTKEALKALEKGDKKAALEALALGFGTLVNTQIIIPTPLLAAQDLVIDASKLDKSKKEEAQKLLSLAKEELKRAELLGYTKKHDAAYKLISEDIEKIEKEIKGKNIVEKLYEKLLGDFKKLINDTRHETHRMQKRADGLHDSVALKAEEALKNPKAIKGHSQAQERVEEATIKMEAQARKKADLFNKEVAQDMKDTVK